MSPFLIKTLHTIDWIFLALNIQLIEGVLWHRGGTPDPIHDKFVRWITTPSALKGWLGVFGLCGEIYLLWFT